MSTGRLRLMFILAFVGYASRQISDQTQERRNHFQDCKHSFKQQPRPLGLDAGYVFVILSSDVELRFSLAPKDHHPLDSLKRTTDSFNRTTQKDKRAKTRANSLQPNNHTLTEFTIFSSLTSQKINMKVQISPSLNDSWKALSSFKNEYETNALRSTSFSADMKKTVVNILLKSRDLENFSKHFSVNHSTSPSKEVCTPREYLQDFQKSCNITSKQSEFVSYIPSQTKYTKNTEQFDVSILSVSISLLILSNTSARQQWSPVVKSLLGMLSPHVVIRTAIAGKRLCSKKFIIAEQTENEINRQKLVWSPVLPGVKMDYFNHKLYLQALMKTSRFLGFGLEEDTDVQQKVKTNKKDHINDVCWKTCIGSFRPRQPQVVTAYPAFLPSAGSSPAEMMSFIGYRLGSLSSLPARCNVSRVRLAEAGFYYDHSKTDRDQTNVTEVVCYSCGLKYGQWKDGDSPVDIHRALNPDCSHLKTLPGNPARTSTASLAPAVAATLPENLHQSWSSSPTSADSAYSSGTPNSFPHQQLGLQPSLSSDQGYHSAHSHSSGFSSSHGNDSGFSSGIHSSSSGWNNSKYISSDLATDCSAIAPSPTEQATAGTSASQSSTVTSHKGYYDESSGTKRTPMEDLPPIDMRSAVYPQFSLTHDRKVTFVNWPLGHIFQPDVLVAQGFYYAGYADCIRCFYCGVGLKSWVQSDDVMKEHIRWRPSCGYILSTKGRHFVDKVLEELEKTNTENGNSNDSTVQAVTAPTASNATVAQATASVASNRYIPAATTISRNSSSSSSVNASRAAPRPASGVSAPGAVSAAPRNSRTSSPSPSPPPSGSSSVGNGSSEVLRKVEEMGFKKEDIARAVRLLQSQGQTKISVDQLVQTILDLPIVDTTPVPPPSAAATTTTTRDTLQTDSEPTTQGRTSGASRQPKAELDLAQRLVLENEQLRSRQTCKLCRQAKVGMIFMPCGHVLACTACGSNTRHCPLCGQFIRATANIYLS